jgi:hypothetical protein
VSYEALKTESLTCVTPVLVRDHRGELDPTVLRTALRKAFNQNIAGGSLTGTERRAIQRIERHSLPVRALSDDAAATDMLNALPSSTESRRRPTTSPGAAA